MMMYVLALRYDRSYRSNEMCLNAHSGDMKRASGDLEVQKPAICMEMYTNTLQCLVDRDSCFSLKILVIIITIIIMDTASGSDDLSAPTVRQVLFRNTWTVASPEHPLDVLCIGVFRSRSNMSSTQLHLS